MKILFSLTLLFCCRVASAQNITAQVVDAANHKPLAYAIVVYQNAQKVVYTDANGYFTLMPVAVTKDDSVSIQFIGYQRLMVNIRQVVNGAVFSLEPQIATLNPVVVSNCKKTGNYVVNRKTGRIKQYIGPGPETRLIIIARYNNASGKSGYVNKVSILINEKLPAIKIPVRLRWYDWNEETGMPGKELTDTSIIVYPYKEGWNDFDVPEKNILCDKHAVVFGLEFIYSPEYKQQFDSLKTDNEKLQWLNDMKNRWSMALQYVSDKDDGGFYIVNNSAMSRYTQKGDRFYIRPAVRFTITVCKD